MANIHYTVMHLNLSLLVFKLCINRILKLLKLYFIISEVISYNSIPFLLAVLVISVATKPLNYVYEFRCWSINQEDEIDQFGFK